MKRSVNLKKWFDELRAEPQPPIEMLLQLDADFYKVLKQLASQERLSTEAYILKLLSSHAETALTEEKTGQDG